MKYIIPVAFSNGVAVIEALAARDRSRAETLKRHGQQRAEETRLVMAMNSATLQLCVVTANALYQQYKDRYVQQDTMNADAAAATSKYYSATLTPANWSASGNVFKNTYSNTELRASVSPVVSCTENAAEYAYITDAEATAKTGIVFTARKKPTANIILTIIDVG